MRNFLCFLFDLAFKSVRRISILVDICKIGVYEKASSSYAKINSISSFDDFVKIHDLHLTPYGEFDGDLDEVAETNCMEKACITTTDNDLDDTLEAYDCIRLLDNDLDDTLESDDCVRLLDNLQHMFDATDVSTEHLDQGNHVHVTDMQFFFDEMPSVYEGAFPAMLLSNILRMCFAVHGEVGPSWDDKSLKRQATILSATRRS